jgi:hypothetical protein
VLPHPPAAPLHGPNRPTPDEDNSNPQERIIGGRCGNTRHWNEKHELRCQ